MPIKSGHDVLRFPHYRKTSIPEITIKSKIGLPHFDVNSLMDSEDFSTPFFFGGAVSDDFIAETIRAL